MCVAYSSYTLSMYFDPACGMKLGSIVLNLVTTGPRLNDFNWLAISLVSCLFTLYFNLCR